MVDRTPASDVFELEIVQPSRLRHRLRNAAVIVANVVGQSDVLSGGGGRRARFVDKRTGSQIAEFREPLGESTTSTFTVVLSDYTTMDADEFQRTWIQPTER